MCTTCIVFVQYTEYSLLPTRLESYTYTSLVCTPCRDFATFILYNNGYFSFRSIFSFRPRSPLVTSRSFAPCGHHAAHPAALSSRTSRSRAASSRPTITVAVDVPLLSPSPVANAYRLPIALPFTNHLFSQCLCFSDQHLLF